MTRDWTVSDWIAHGMGVDLRDGVAVGYCRACGHWRSGTPWAQALHTLNLTIADANALTVGTVICASCAHCLRADDSCQRSHLVTADGRWYGLDLDRADARVCARDLLRTNTLPVVLISLPAVPIHLVLHARVGWWQVGDLQTPPCALLLTDLLRAMDEACALGATRESIGTGGDLWMTGRLAELEATCFARRRMSASFQLALRLIA